MGFSWPELGALRWHWDRRPFCSSFSIVEKKSTSRGGILASKVLSVKGEFSPNGFYL
jgi:hypothetical protein